MDRTFNDFNCKINSILNSANLGHLHSKFVKKCVTMDTLMNLKEEDLDYLDITDPHERNIILRDFNIYQQHLTDIDYPSKFNRTRMLLTSVQQLNAVNSLMSTLLSSLRRQEARATCKDDDSRLGSSASVTLNPLLDDVTPVAVLVNAFITQSLSSLHHYESDIATVLNECEGKGRSSRMLTAVCLAGCLTVSLPLVGLLLWNQAKQIIPSISPSSL